MIAPAVLHEMFNLDEETGTLYWKSVSKYHSEKIGERAGVSTATHSGKRYWVIQIGGRKYKRSKIVFAMVNGYWPPAQVDHRDCDSENDRPDNLRPATHLQNAWNRKKVSKKSALPMGVRSVKSGRFQARIICKGVTSHLGTYATPDEASTVYQQKRKEMFGDYA